MAVYVYVVTQCYVRVYLSIHQNIDPANEVWFKYNGKD